MGRSLLQLSEVLNGTNHLAGVGVLVIVPGNYLNLVEIVCDSYEALGIKPLVLPIRGGTDGAQLSFRGLPCPNLGTGGYCGHSVNEFVVVSQMERVVDVLQELARRFAE